MLAHSARVAGAMIGNDLKQGLRKHLAAKNWRARMVQAFGLACGLLFFAALHYAAFALVAYLDNSITLDRTGLFTGVSTAIWGFLLFVMLSGGLMRALVVLHEQDDSSLLLASPASPRAILAAKLFGNALQSCAVDGFIIVPWLDVRIFVFHQWAWLWGFAVWLAVAVIVTCVDGLFSFGLIRGLGMRRARLFSQAIPFALIFGVTFFAGSASLSFAALGADNGMPRELQQHFIALSHTPLAILARAAAGQPLELLGIFAGATALAWLTLRVTERTFVTGTQDAAGNDATSSPADAPFRSHLFLIEIRKNLRLVVRTPMMLVQCIAQVLTPIGIAVVLGRDDPARAAAFFTIFVAGVLAGILTIAAGTVEEGSDLLGMSPRPLRLFRLGKIASGCLWPLALALVVGAILFVVGRPLEASAVWFGGIPLGFISSLVGETFANPVRPGVRPKLLSDPVMMIPLLGMQITGGMVAGATVFAAAFSGWALAVTLLATYLLLLLGFGLAQLRRPIF